MSNPNPPIPITRAPRWLVWLGLLALAAYGVFIELHFSNVAGSSDPSGYFNSAKLLAAGKLQTELRVPREFGPAEKLNPLHFLPLGFWPFSDSYSKIAPTYPTGVPLHFVVAGKLVDWITGPRLVGVFAAVGAVWLCYAVGRELGLAPILAAAGALTLGVCPIFLFTSFWPMSDTLAATWGLAAVWSALRARRARGWAVACGATFAICVLVRPTNLLFAPAIMVLLGLDWRRLALWAAGGLPGALWLAGYNHALYHRALTSGYGEVFELFAWSSGPPTAWHFTKWLALLLPAPLLALPFAAMASREFRTSRLLALALWFAAITGCYLFYAHSREFWWSLRFIVPAIPALILGGLLGVEALVQQWASGQPDRCRQLAALAIGVWALGLSVFWVARFSILDVKNAEKTFVRVCDAARAQLPPDTLVVTMTFSGAFYYYTDFPVLRWDQVEPAQFARYAALARQAGRTVAAVDFPWEEKRAIHEHCPGNWTLVEKVSGVNLWRLAPPPAEVGVK